MILKEMAHASTKERFESTGFTNEWDLAESSFIQGFLVAQDMAARLAEDWGKNYPEDIFTPFPAYGSPEQQAQDNLLVTRASAHAGRHFSKTLASEIRAMGAE